MLSMLRRFSLWLMLAELTALSPPLFPSAHATVNSSVNKTIALGNGSQTQFTFNFIGVATAYIGVIYTDASGNETVLAQGSGTTQYQIVLNSSPQGGLWGIGGTVTYNPNGAPIANGTTLTIFRTLPLTQAISLQNLISLSALGKGSETGLDTLEMQLQQVSEIFNRAVVAPIVDPANVTLTLPAASQRANLVMCFDSFGDVTACSALPAGTVSSVMQPVVNASTLAQARAALGIVSTTGVFDAVLQFGADPTGVTSSTTAINNTIAAACAANVRGTAYIPPGTYLVNGGVNATNIGSGCTINGAGLTTTILKVTSATNAILDMTGSSAVSVNNLQLADGGSAVANYGIIFASSTLPSPCNVNHLSGISLSANWIKTAIYIYGCSDGSIANSQISNFNTGAIACFAVVGTNEFSAASSYTTIATNGNSGDWLFRSLEIHDLSHQGGGFSTVKPLYISGAFSPLKFIGGLVAGPATAGANIGAVTFGFVGSGASIGGVSFIGTQVYSDNGQPPAFAFYSNATVAGLVIEGSNIQAATAVFSEATAGFWSGLNYTGNANQGALTMFYTGGGAGTSGTLSHSIIDAQGGAINMGAGGTLTHTVMLNPGTITAGTQANNGSF